MMRFVPLGILFLVACGGDGPAAPHTPGRFEAAVRGALTADIAGVVCFLDNGGFFVLTLSAEPERIVFAHFGPTPALGTYSVGVHGDASSFTGLVVTRAFVIQFDTGTVSVTASEPSRASGAFDVAGGPGEFHTTVRGTFTGAEACPPSS